MCCKLYIYIKWNINSDFFRIIHIQFFNYSIFLKYYKILKNVKVFLKASSIPWNKNSNEITGGGEGIKVDRIEEEKRDQRRKIERNNLIYIFTLKQSSFFPPQRASPCENALARVNIYNRTVKSVPRANIQLILNSFGKSAPGEMQISRSDLGHTRPESWTTQTETQIYLETESCFTHCTKHEAASCSHNENFPHGFYPYEIVHYLIEKRKRKV